MKRTISLLMAFVLILSLLCVPAFAASSLTYDLTSGGSNTVTARTNDTITVTFSIHSSDGFSFNALQNKIDYDDDFFELVSSSITPVKGSAAATESINLKKYVKAEDLNSSYGANETICTFQLKVIGTSGSGSVTCNDCQARDTSNHDIPINTNNLTVTINTSSKENTPNASFAATGSSTGTLSNVTSGMKYSINGGSSWTNITSASVNLTGLSAGTIKVYKPGNGTTTTDSDVQTITVTKASTPNLSVTQPSSVGGTGSVATTSAHEYSTNGTSWISCSGTLSNLAAGTYYVRVKANGTALASEAQTVTINAFTLSSISVKTAPNKTSYIAGQSFDSTGMVIEAKYSDNSTATVTGWSVTDGTNLTTGKTSVTVSYTEGGVTKTATQAITVTTKAVSSIAVKTQPTKTVYNAGESFNASGLVITVTYNDGSSEDVSSGFVVTPNGALTISNTSVTVTYGGKTTTIPITVKAVAVTGVSLNKNSTSIQVGSSETLTATVAPSNATNKNVTWTSSDSSVATVNTSGKVTAVKEGTAIITVTTQDSNKTATCTVTVTKATGGGGGTVVPADPIVAAFASDGGTITPSGSQTVKPGSSITFKMKANDGCTLEAVFVDGKNVGAVSEYTFRNVREAHTIYASFNDPNGGSYKICPRDATCPIEPFTDTVNDAWWHDGIHYCVEHKLMQGVSNTSFNPTGTTTRAMIVTILWRLEGEPVANYAMSFKDVPSGEWYTEAVRWAQSTGVVAGYSAEAFGPTDPITREQMATILYRYAEYHGINVANTNALNGYSDKAQVSSWALDAMKWANGAGLVQGRTVTTLVPGASITRAEAAAMIQRYCEKVK